MTENCEKLEAKIKELKSKLRQSNDKYNKLRKYHDKVMNVLNSLPFSISDFIEDDSP